MILRTKPYTVGCGIQLNPNGSDIRCGQKRGAWLSNSYSEVQQMLMPVNSAYETALCENCKVRQHANALMHLIQERQK